MTSLGEDWDTKFSRFLPPEIKINTYTWSRMNFEQANIYNLINEFLNIPKEMIKKDSLIVYLEKKAPELIRELERNESFYKEYHRFFKKKDRKR